MGKITLSLIATCVVIFALCAIQVLDPSSTFTGLVFGGCGGIALFFTGPMWLGKKIFNGMSVQAESELRAKLSSESSLEIGLLTDTQICELVDEAVNKLPAVANHPWLAQHWHKLNASEKNHWIKERRIFLNTELASARMPMEYVSALQKSDSQFATKAG